MMNGAEMSQGTSIGLRASDARPHLYQGWSNHFHQADLLGDDVAQQLEVLHDQLPPPIKQSDREQRVEIELPLDALFSDLTEISISAASVAQFTCDHADGQDVAVKTLRPGIKAAFNRDLVPLHFWARVAETIVPPLRQLKPTALVAEFRRQVAIELDLRLEAASMSEIAACMKMIHAWWSRRWIGIAPRFVQQ